MFRRLVGFIVICLCSFPVLAKSDMACLDNQTACSQPCIAKGDMACLERCLSEGKMCLEKESQATNKVTGGATASNRNTSSSNGSTNLQGCWRSEAKLTTWCFTGTTSVITTDSYAASGGKRITGLDRVTLSGSSMTYYIIRAAMTGPGAYDNSVNKGPYTQAYTYSNTRTPSFFAAGDEYVKQ